MNCKLQDNLLNKFIFFRLISSGTEIVYFVNAIYPKIERFVFIKYILETMNIFSILLNAFIQTISMIVISFVLAIIILYLNKQLRELLFAWGFTLYSSFLKYGSDSIRAKLFKTLPYLKTSDSSNQLVILFF
jgi:hypothetical protein